MQSEIKSKSEHLIELDTLEINAIWRMQYFFVILPKYNSIQFQYLQNWYRKCNSEGIQSLLQINSN